MASVATEEGEAQLMQAQQPKQVFDTEDFGGLPEDLDSMDADALARLDTRTTHFTNQRVSGPPLRREREEEGDETECEQGEKRRCTDRGGLDITLADGSTMHLSKKSAARDFDMNMREPGTCLLERSIHEISEEVALQRSLNTAREDAEPEPEPEPRRQKKQANHGQLWVDKHRPKSFMHLLSDERTNRNVLAWIKTWDSIVFGKKENKDALTSGPEFKVLLLHGPPGTGKTTLAHILAKQAGYKPVEINASDERTASGLRTRLDALMEMKAMFGDARPNCIILDEIDGTAGAEGQGAVDLVVKLCKDTAAGGGGGGGRRRVQRRKGGKKKKEQVLRRPIICICNDLYTPALRPLRAVAQLVKFTPPPQQRMITRLQHICHEEKLSVDRQALCLLHEMHNGDIRSCINALQTISYDSEGHVDVRQLREKGSSVRDCNMSTGLFDVWNAVFKIPGGNDKSLKKVEGKEGPLVGLLNAHQGNMGLIIQGCHHNVLNVKYNDPRMIKTAACMEELGDTDIISRYVSSTQNWGVAGYMKIACQRLHLECAAPQWPQIEYPRQASEATAALKQHGNMLSAVWGSMPPGLRHYYTPQLLIADVLPLVQRVLEPQIKLGNMALMSAEHKAQMQAHVDIMMALGLSYRHQHQARTAGERSAAIAIEPNFEEVVQFPKRREGEGPQRPAASAPISQELMKHLQQMLEQSQMRKSAESSASKQQASPAKLPSDHTPAATPAKHILAPGLAAKLEEAEARAAAAGKVMSWGHAGWASATQHKERRTVATCTNTHPARYRFNEGVTKAIKRTVHIRDLL